MNRQSALIFADRQKFNNGDKRGWRLDGFALMMRRPGVVGLDTFQLHGFEHARLALHLFFQKLDEPALAGHDLVQLLDLVFQMGDVGFEPVEPLQGFSVHGLKIRSFSKTGKQLYGAESFAVST
jgi:hypothetical protein